jgi:hypothetical protein
MRMLGGLTAATVTIALAIIASAANPYDGTYVGTSLTLTGTTAGSGRGEACTTSATAPAPLTISNGHAQTKWGNGTLEGDVGADGKLIMHSNLAGRFEGQIDGSGTLKGSYQGYCIFALSWKRRG